MRGALAIALALGLAGSAVAQDEEPPAAAVGHLTERVDFDKTPNLVEAYNKTRILSCEAQREEAGMSLAIAGESYYPDGTILVVTVRYWKHQRVFRRVEAVVQDQAFAVVVGPFTRALPGGKYVVGAWFSLDKQPPPIVTAMRDGSYFSCSPPCRFDRLAVHRWEHDLGAERAQARAEQLEKDQFAAALESLLNARRATNAVLVGLRGGNESPQQGRAALETLASDIQSAMSSLQTWTQGRQILLFPEQAAHVDTLAAAIREEAALHGAAAGLTAEGLPTGAEALIRYGNLSEQVQGTSDRLRGFLAEQSSLDQAWARLAEEAQSRADERAREAEQE